MPMTTADASLRQAAIGLQARFPEHLSLFTCGRGRLSNLTIHCARRASNHPSSSITLTPCFSRLLELRAGAGAGDDEVGLLRHRARDLGAEPLGHRLRLVAGHLLQRAGEDHGLAGDRRVDAAASAGSRRDLARAARRASPRLCSSSKKSTSASATISPMPSIEVDLAQRLRVAVRPLRARSSRRLSKVPKWRARSRALVSPTWRMPSA